MTGYRLRALYGLDSRYLVFWGLRTAKQGFRMRLGFAESLRPVTIGSIVVPFLGITL